MQNVAPVRALNRRSTQLLQLGFVVLAVGIFLAVIGLAMMTILLLPPSHPMFRIYTVGGNLVFIAGLVVAVLGIALAIRAVTRRRENDLAFVTGDWMSHFLDARFFYVRNINRSGLGYIDAVLVGPPGALVFRIVNYRGAYANEASTWMKQNGRGQWSPFWVNLTKQAVDDIRSLRNYLARNNLADVPVYGVIVFTQDPSRVSIVEKNPVVPVSHLQTLMDNLRHNYFAKQDRIPQATAVAVSRLLLE
jgi:hypothetical protein